MFYVDIIVNNFEKIPKTSFPGEEVVSNASLGGDSITGGGGGDKGG